MSQAPTPPPQPGAAPSPATAPARLRPAWPELPAPVREAIEVRLGARVTSWTSHERGYSSGLASVLETSAGPVFVKAQGPENTYTQELYREEARRHAVLPETIPAPRLRWQIEVPEVSWVALALDAVPGRPAPETLDGDDLARVADLARGISQHEIPHGDLPEIADLLDIDPWPGLAGADLSAFDPWVREHLGLLTELTVPRREAVAGPHLQHNDLRTDNALIIDLPAPGHAVAVDWPWASRGAAYTDLVGMLPALRHAGGPAPEEVLARHPLPPGTDEDAVTCFLAVLAGMWVERALQPPPPGIPHLRSFQRAQGEVTIAWLRRRLRS